MVAELAALELLFCLCVQDGLAWGTVASKMELEGVYMPLTFDPEDIVDLSRKNVSNARRNINLARDDLMEHLGGYFVPEQDDLLYKWLHDDEAYTKERRVEAEIFKLNPNSRMMQMSLEAAWKIRHIFFSFNLPAVSVGALWACFYAVIMHREIPNDCFVSASTIWNNAMRIEDIDKHITTDSF